MGQAKEKRTRKRERERREERREEREREKEGKDIIVCVYVKYETPFL